MLDQLHDYLLTIREKVLPKSDAGQAVAYTLKNWTALTRYRSDGDLPIDNNAPNDPCAASRWDETTGPSLAATTAAGRQLCCAALFPPASWSGSIPLPGSKMCSAALPTIPSRGSKNCCFCFVGLPGSNTRRLPAIIDTHRQPPASHLSILQHLLIHPVEQKIDLLDTGC
jgi:hypothetical protein